MSRIFSDRDLLSWEVFASTGPFGLPEHPQIVFHCLSDPDRRARYIRVSGDSSEAQALVQEARESDLRQMLTESRELS
jgi:hypothetical protein